MRLSKKLFFLLILLLPLNLGKHFEVTDSYVWGILSDYLVPAIYIQDIVIVGIIISWFREKGFPSKLQIREHLNNKYAQLIIFMLFSIGLSVIGSDRPLPSLAILIRIILYVALFYYVVFEVELEKDFLFVIKLLSVDLLILSVLAAGQFIKQGAIFNNYLFLGEQPYTFSTWGIDREQVLGVAKVPAYGLFRHPNVFGGFLSLVLLWIYPYIKRSLLNKIAFFAGLAALFLTFSFVAWAGFLLGYLSYLYISYFKGRSILDKKKQVVGIFIIMFLLVNLLAPLLVNFRSHSFFRRGDLFNLSLRVVSKNPLFGVGPGNFVSGLGDLAFTQPVHNIFLLIFSESGVFALVFFILLVYSAIKKMISPSYFFVFLISLLQITFMGTLDHYFWTIHQTLLLLWLTLGFSFSKNG